MLNLPTESLDALLIEIGMSEILLDGHHKISLGGVSYTKKALAEKIKRDIYRLNKYFDCLVFAERSEELIGYLRSKAPVAKDKNSLDWIKDPYTEMPDGNIVKGDFHYYADVRNSEAGNLRVISYNPKNRKIGSFSAEADLKISGFPQKDFVKLLPAYTVFDPHMGESLMVKELPDGRQFRVLNTFEIPCWTESVKSLEDVKELPPLFRKLVDHLFGKGTVDQEFFFHWLYMSLFDRALTYLILCGLPGIGKNRLKSVMRALHGHANSVDGKKSTVNERFNSQLDKSTLVWFDELSYSSENENILKEIQNTTISIEKKGVDATGFTRIFCSMVISNNKHRDNFIAFDARKFVPLNLNENRLEASMTSEEISELSNKVEVESSPDFDKDFLIAIARWVKKFGYRKKWANCEYRGEMFWRLATSTAPAWQRAAVDFLLNDHKPSQVIDRLNPGVYKWSEIVKALSKNQGFRRWQPDNGNAEYFFNIFRDFNGEPCFKTRKVDTSSLSGDFYIFNLRDPELIKNLNEGGVEKLDSSFDSLSLLQIKNTDKVESKSPTPPSPTKSKSPMKEDSDEYLDF